MKSQFLLNFMLMVLIFSASAQENIAISGRVTDANSGESLQFVNVGIEGSLVGTASDKNGIFRFTVPKELSDGKLFFSAIGYELLSIPLQSYLKQPGLVVLEAQTYGIEDVEIQSKSMVAYRVVRDAVYNIPERFIHQACHYKAQYVSEIYDAGGTLKKREAEVLITDPEGYTAQFKTDAHRNYRFLSVQRNFEIHTLADGSTLMDELLLADAAAAPANVLNPAYLHEYELEILENHAASNDTIQVLAFRHPAPDISRTGHYHVNTYQGTIFIHRNDHVPVGLEIMLTANAQSRHGAMAVAQPDEGIQQVTKTFSISYKKTAQGYVPDRLKLEQTAINQWKKTLKTEAQLKIISVETQTPEQLSTRQYFEKMTPEPMLAP